MQKRLLILFFLLVFSLTLLSFVSAENIILKESETLNVSGHTFLINFISSTEVILNVDGISTNSISEGETQTLSNGVTILIIDILFDSKDTGISSVIFSFTEEKSKCKDSNCILYEGETLTFSEHTFLISFISSTEVVLAIDGKNTISLNEGQKWELSDGYITIIDILFDSKDTGISSVIFSFTVSGEEEKPVVIPKEKPEDIPDENVACIGCKLDGKCYPLGYRKSGEYCSDSFEFVTQLEAGFSCENNFECGSNVCIGGECVSQSLIQKILNWLKEFFS